MNAILENIRVALSGLLSNKLRAALTTLGISIGVAAVIVLVSLGQAVQDFVAQQFLGIGTNLAFVLPASVAVGRPGGSGIPAAGRSSLTFSSITERDFEALVDPLNVPDARYVAPLLRINRDVLYNGNKARARIHGTTPDFFPARTRKLILGRYFDTEDMSAQARVAVIGLTNVKALFPDTVSPVGETIRIDNVPFKVIGVFEKYGGTSFNDEDDIVAIPLTTAYARLSSNRNASGQRPLSVIYLSAFDTTMDTMVEQATEVLRKTHDIKFRQEDNFQILTQKDLLESFGQITGLLTIFLGVIAGISLLVGGIGIMNIMLVTVTERTREIGLRKAVGARNGDILLQFVIEAITLAMVGGLFGLGVATIGTILIRLFVPTLDAVVRPESVLLAIGISTAIGVFFGMYPASRAAALNPIEALRYE